MFVSLMALLHERLPCAENCFRLKRVFRNEVESQPVKKGHKQQTSPLRLIASPRMLKGLTLVKCFEEIVLPRKLTIQEINVEEEIECFEP